MTTETILTQEQVDTLLDGVLRASGSRLANYTSKKTLDDLRSAVRDIEQAVLQSQDREDALRYQWLRKHWFTMSSDYTGGRVEFKTGMPRYSEATEKDVDAAIDHARRVEEDGE